MKESTKKDTGSDEVKKCEEISFSEAMLQVVFLINNERYDSAMEVVKTNEITIAHLIENGSIKNLDTFKKLMNNN